MRSYIEKLNAYLDSRPMKLEGADFDSVLDFLYNTYVEYHPIDTKEIQKQWQSIESILESLFRYEIKTTRDAAAIFGCCAPRFLFAISSRFQRLFSLMERKIYGQLGFHARKPCCKPLFMPLNSDFNPLCRRPIPAHAILSRPLPPVRSALPYSGLHRYSATQRCCWKARRVHIPLPHLSYRYKE